MGTVNYTTKVAAAVTVGEIQQMLAEHGATAIMVRYDARTPTAVAFQLTVRDVEAAYALPVDVDAMRRSLMRQWNGGGLRGIRPATAASPAHAARVAWRVLKDWLAAQLALIEAGQAQLDQVMLPYLRVDADTTVYDAYLEHGARMLTAGAGR